MPCAGGNHNHVPNLQVVWLAVSNFRTVIARPIKFDNSPQRGGTSLPVRNIGTENESGRTGDDVVNLADQVMLGDGAGRGLVQLSAVDHTDTDMSLSDPDISYLLVNQFFCNCLLCVRLQFRHRYVGSRAHVAGRLRVGRIDLALRHH